MACGSSSRSGRRSSCCRNPHGGFHCIAPKPAGSGRERKRVLIDADEAYRLYRRYEAAPRDVKMPDGWHLNSNRVPIPLPPTGCERSLAIDEHRRLAGPELLADPRFAGKGSAWDDLFQGNTMSPVPPSQRSRRSGSSAIAGARPAPTTRTPPTRTIRAPTAKRRRLCRLQPSSAPVIIID